MKFVCSIVLLQLCCSISTAIEDQREDSANAIDVATRRPNTGEYLPEEYDLPQNESYIQLSNEDEEKDDLTETIKLSQIDIDFDSDIKRQLQAAYDNLDDNLKTHPTILQIVQVTFQRLNITSRDHLPKTTVKTVELFQKLPFHMASLALVQNAFNLRQPEYIHPPIVGQGYDVLKDETVAMSPFVVNEYKPTSIGYSFPDNLICKTEDENTMENFELLQSYEHYKDIRLKDLSVQDAVNSSAFVGTVRFSYNNINPDSDAFVTLSAIKQFRNFKLDLIESSPLDEEFKTAVNDLTPFNQSDKESPKEWKSFFNKYGTHVVTEAYGGGYMEGKASGDSINRNLRQNRVLLLAEIKDNLLSFKRLPFGVGKIEISHSFYGGSPDARLAKAHELPSQERKKLLRKWKDSVRSDPRILEMNLKLTPISTIARLVNDEIGRDVGNALNHLLNGTLDYVRVRPSKKGTTRAPTTTTTTPMTTATTPLTTTTTTSSTENPFYYYPTEVMTATPTPKCQESYPCPTCPEIPNCDPCSCPTVSPADIQQDPCPKAFPDFTENENVIGQGYHILKDAVLSESPFVLTFQNYTINENSPISLPVGASISKLDRPCTYARFYRFKTHSEYVKERLGSIYKSLLVLETSNGEPIKYEGSVRPGYNIMDNLRASGPFSSYEEWNYFQVKVDLSQFKLKPKFEQDLSGLPYYRFGNENCADHEKWLDFFDTYGTHVVTEVNAGQQQITLISGLNAHKGLVEPNYNRRKQSEPECKPSESYYDTNPLRKAAAAVAVESAKKERMDKILQAMRKSHNNFVYSYDYAVTHLLENKLARC